MTPIRKFLVAGIAAVGLAATAALAGSIHHMAAAPDGGARPGASGDGTPRARFLTPEMINLQMNAPQADGAQMNRGPVFLHPAVPFAGMERLSWMMDRQAAAMAADMDRQMAAALVQARGLAAMPQPVLNTAGLNDAGPAGAAARVLPSGTRSWSITTIRTGHGLCTVRIVNAGMGPRMVSQSGCDGLSAPAAATPVRAELAPTPTPRHRI